MSTASLSPHVDLALDREIPVSFVTHFATADAREPWNRMIWLQIHAPDLHLRLALDTETLRLLHRAVSALHNDASQTRNSDHRYKARIYTKDPCPF